MSITSVMPSNHLILCCPLLLPPSICPSIRVFSNESVLHIRWPKYCSFSFSISPSNTYSGLTSFRFYWFDLLASTGLEKAMAPHSSTLAWKIPWTEEPGKLQSMGSLGVRHDWATSLSLSCLGEGNGNPLQCSCLENPRDGGAWWAAVSGVAQNRTRLKRLSSSSSGSVAALLQNSQHFRDVIHNY